MRNPETDLKRGLILAILITSVIYVVVSLVALGNLTPAEVAKDQEYVLAVAARPTLGQVGFVLIGIAALMSTASAINATLFGSARLAMVMAAEHALPRVFSLRERTREVPWVSLVVLSVLTVAFVLPADLTIISSFASAAFLAIFAAVNFSAWRLRARIRFTPQCRRRRLFSGRARYAPLACLANRPHQSRLDRRLPKLLDRSSPRARSGPRSRPRSREGAVAPGKPGGLGTFGGVFTPSILTILGRHPLPAPGLGAGQRRPGRDPRHRHPVVVHHRC